MDSEIKDFSDYFEKTTVNIDKALKDYTINFKKNINFEKNNVEFFNSNILNNLNKNGAQTEQPKLHRLKTQKKIDDESEISFDDCIEVLAERMNFYSALSRHIESYNHFVFNVLPSLVKKQTIRVICKNTNEIHILQFGDLYYSFPRIHEKIVDNEIHNSNNTDNAKTTPNIPILNKKNFKSFNLHSGISTITNHIDCEKRKLSYFVNLFIKNNKYIIQDKNKNIKKIIPQEDVFLGEFPVMVGSELDVMICGTRHPSELGNNKKKNILNYIKLKKKGWEPYDYGGYFVINGTQKIFIGIQEMQKNHPFIFYAANKKKYIAEIRSIGSNRLKSPTKLEMICLQPNSKNSFLTEINVQITFLNSSVPLSILLFSLGAKSKEEVCDLILGPEEIRNKTIPEKNLKQMMLILDDIMKNSVLENILKCGSDNSNSTSSLPNQFNNNNNNASNNNLNDFQKFVENINIIQKECMFYIGYKSISSLDLIDDKTEEEMNLIVKNRLFFAFEFLKNSLLPHMGQSHSKTICNFREKLIFLCNITRRLLNVITGLEGFIFFIIYIFF